MEGLDSDFQLPYYRTYWRIWELRHVKSFLREAGCSEDVQNRAFQWAFNGIAWDTLLERQLGQYPTDGQSVQPRLHGHVGDAGA